jgi:hypothetical protein
MQFWEENLSPNHLQHQAVDFVSLSKEKNMPNNVHFLLGRKVVNQSHATS